MRGVLSDLMDDLDCFPPVSFIIVVGSMVDGKMGQGDNNFFCSFTACHGRMIFLEKSDRCCDMVWKVRCK